MQKSLNEKNFKNAWVVQLLSYVDKLDYDKTAGQIKTEVGRNRGQFSSSPIGGSCLISEARGLEGKDQIAQLMPSPHNFASHGVALNFLGAAGQGFFHHKTEKVAQNR